MELKTLHGLVIGTKSNITNSLISHKKINKKNLPIRDENSTKKKRSHATKNYEINVKKTSPWYFEMQYY